MSQPTLAASVGTGNSPAPLAVPIKERVRERVPWHDAPRRRLIRAVDYLSLYLFIVVVYGGAIVADYVIFSLMWWLVSEDAKTYPLVAELLDYARIGLAILFIAGAVIHGILSTASQVKLDYGLSKEDQRKNDTSES